MEWVSPCASERSSQSCTAPRGVVETPENMAGFSRTPLAVITPGEREKWREIFDYCTLENLEKIFTGPKI